MPVKRLVTDQWDNFKRTLVENILQSIRKQGHQEGHWKEIGKKNNQRKKAGEENICISIEAILQW